MRTTLLTTVVFCVGVMAGGTALAQSVTDPDGNDLSVTREASPETGNSSGREDNPGYVYSPETVPEDDLSLRSSAGMTPIFDGTARNSGGCDLTTHLNTPTGCVPIGPD
jgi:hypothetical protein